MNWLSQLPEEIPVAWKKALIAPGSLTSTLKSLAQEAFTCHLLTQRETPVAEDICEILQLSPNSLAYTREVHLCCDYKPWSYGKTIIPHDTFEDSPLGLAALGSRSIGSILFTHPGVTRGHFSFALITKEDSLWHDALQQCSYKPETLWARRSCFTIDRWSLLVIEVFLPPYYHYLLKTPIHKDSVLP